MLRIEDKLTQTAGEFAGVARAGIEALADVPPALSLGENMNAQPVKLPLFVNAQLGFMAVYPAGRLRRPGAQADPRPPHRADRPQHVGTLAQRRRACAAQPVLAGTAVPLLGATRDDFASKNAVARAALEKFGELPQDVLEGTRRSRFAPPIARRAGKPGAAADAAPSLAQSTWRTTTRTDEGAKA